MENITEKGKTRYTGLAIVFHWIIAMMVFLLIVLGLSMTDIPRGTSARSVFYNFHKSVGLTVGVLMFLRLWWRLRNPPPPLPETMASWQIKLSKISHVMLYACLFIMPISGFAATQFTKWGLKFFGLFKIPPLAFESKAIYTVLQNVHQVAGWILIVIISVHILGALKHGLIDRDNVLQRIFIPRDKDKTQSN